MRNVETITVCLEIATTRCLHVWQFLSKDQFSRYHREWLSGGGREDETAVFSSVVAIGARFFSGDPTCAHANTLFMGAQELSFTTAGFTTTTTGLKAIYVMVFYSDSRANSSRRYIVIIL
jgi:hypothetical protein